MIDLVFRFEVMAGSLELLIGNGAARVERGRKKVPVTDWKVI